MSRSKLDLLKWGCLQTEKGIMVGASQDQEWLLPWWWHHYSLYNHYPVAFADFGMSLKAKKWCQKKGHVLILPQLPKSFFSTEDQVDPKLLKKWKRSFNKNYFPTWRAHWFKKPLIMLKTPFEKTIWIDLDCQVRALLEELFAKTGRAGVGCIQESWQIQLERCQQRIQQEGEVLYNSGVVVYKHGSNLVQKWAEKALKSNHLFWGDQEILSHLIFQDQESVFELPRIYNWFSIWENNPEARILHFNSPKGKRFIKKQMRRLSQLSFLQVDWLLD